MADRELLNVDMFSGNPIRKTDNTMRDCDIFSPQDPQVLELDPATGLPVWWDRIKAKEAQDGDC